ncbi:arginine N-succinyltransferase [Rhizorhapis suberifaciens]|uniref:Arginine N-succinyltransferase n=1 Tax=Rhizorhapis suberifaciens TaxID=13656 RepID=A0A840HWP4_9SPHN|nr:arginine N-succinyltransferase [Rhizorhapis suberifaciens]MBB4642000.1 arginine N-succinyltransferase [Rhizorhapis suberifaciens]
MSFFIRPANHGDLQTLYEMAKLTGGGFTNLPADREALKAKLERTEQALSHDDEIIKDELIVLVLENSDTKHVRGTCQLFTQVGQIWPFYSYRVGVLSQNSRELGRTFRAEILNLTTDLEGSSEVGGLFLHPRERAEGLGLLLARSRYLFIRQHRARFGDRILAELRGVIDDAGGSPFWDGLAGRFFGMGFQDADDFNAIHGNQFIADLMPKHPIYTAMLPESARMVIGVPHPSGRAAMRMLETEGFRREGYIDIFDGGPTMTAQTDRLRTIAEAKDATLAGTHSEKGEKMLVTAGRLKDFRCCYGYAVVQPDGAVLLDGSCATLLQLNVGDSFTMIQRW